MMTQISKDCTLLLIEDNDVVRNMLRDMLEGSGYKVIEAVDGEDGIHAFKDNLHCIELIISDVLMPKKNGKQVYDEVRSIKDDVKILFMSGYSVDVLDNSMLEDGRSDFIRKPLRPGELFAKIDGMLAM
ncbi:MAG: response regulator [Thermodesulfovibrionales bacterium]